MVTEVPAGRFSRNISRFGTSFYHECAQTTNGNVIVSPFSVANSLTLLSSGANGKTFNQLRKELHLNGHKEKIGDRISKLMQSLQRNEAGSVIFKMSNQLFVQKGYAISDDFERSLSKFGTGATAVNFKDNVDAADIINTVVESQTSGKIKNFIDPESLTADCRLFLVNTIYFKGNWEKAFDEKKTTKGDFHISTSETVQVDFMSITDSFNFGFLDELKAMALELKYANSRFSLMILQPFEVTGLPALEAQFKSYNVSKILDQMDYSDVNVKIPKFKTEFEVNLKDVLENMGIREMFQETADFSGILASGEPLHVSNAIHKAVIEVNEEGSESAAATGMMISNRSFPSTFHANQPFVYFIWDSNRKIIIFMGRITNFK